MPSRVKVPGPFKYKELPENTVYVGRAVFGYPNSKWANPYKEKTYGRLKAIILWAKGTGFPLVPQGGDTNYEWSELQGKDLACWCDLDQPCHADVLLYNLEGDDGVDEQTHKNLSAIEAYGKKHGYFQSMESK